MRRVIGIAFFVFVFSVFPCFSQALEAGFLNYFFQNSIPKKISISLYDKSESELILAIDSSLDGGNTTQKAIVYSTTKGEYRIFLMILGPYVFGGDGNILVDVSNAPGVFWGWRISPSVSKETGKVINLQFVWVGNGGKKIADPILMPWNSVLECFYEFRPDPSQY